MSNRRFKQALVLLVLVMLGTLGPMFSSAAQGPSPTAQLANQLVDRVKRMRDRAITACSGVVAHTPECKQVRESSNDAYSKVVASVYYLDGDVLMSLSRSIDVAETEFYLHIRTLEASSKTIENILSGR